MSAGFVTLLGVGYSYHRAPLPCCLHSLQLTVPGEKKRSCGINRSEATLQGESWSSHCNEVHPYPTCGPPWKKLFRIMLLLRTSGCRTPIKLCIVTCIQPHRKKPSVVTPGRAGMKQMKQMQVVPTEASWWVCFW